MLDWVLLTFAAAFIWAITDIIDKYITSREHAPPFFAAAMNGLILGVLFVLLGILFPWYLYAPKEVIMIALAAGLFFRAGSFLFYHAIKRGEVSVIGPLTSTQPLFVLLFGVLFLSESFGPLVYIGVVMTIFGAYLLSHKDFRLNHFWDWAAFFALLAAFLFSIRTLLFKYLFGAGVHYFTVLIFFGLGQGVVSLFLLWYEHVHVTPKIKRSALHLVGNASLNVIALGLFTFALTLGPATVVSTLVLSKSLFLFFGVLILSKYKPGLAKERTTRSVLLRKGIALVLLVAGLALVI